MVPPGGHVDLQDRPIRRVQPHVGGDPGCGAADLPKVVQKLPPVRLIDVNDERLADHGAPPHSEQPHRFQVDFADAALRVKRQVAHRRLLVQLRKALVGNLEIRVRLAAGTVSRLTGAKVAPRPAEALPTQTYVGGSIALEVGGRKAQLTHIANAHTDGDTWVYFADANVLCTGDTANNLRRYQNIDYMNGGDVRGMIRALDAYLRVANDTTKIVPGHGPLATKADLTTFRDMLVASHDRIKKLVDEGKSEDEVIGAKPLADFDATWANNSGHAAGHTKNVYNSFKRL